MQRDNAILSRYGVVFALLPLVYLLCFQLGRILQATQEIFVTRVFERAASLVLYTSQDYLVAQSLVVLAIGAFVLRSWRVEGLFEFLGTHNRRLLLVLLPLAGICAWLGAVFAHHGFDLTLDEFLPAFQAEIFLGGHVLAQVPEKWRPFWDSLQPFFVDIDRETGLWGSMYRPVHAALRAGFEWVADDKLLNPTAVVISLGAIFVVAKKLFPKDEWAPPLAVILLLVSPQFLITAFSGFAWSSHLAFNLVWLALFLNGRIWQHFLAMVIGFFAVGLHQVHVHIFFALPLLAAYTFGWNDRRWGLVVAYFLTYAVAIVFWVFWWEIALFLETGRPLTLPGQLSDIAYFSRYLNSWALETDFQPIFRRYLTFTNLARFALWVSPVLIVTILVGLVFRPKLSKSVWILGLSIIFNYVPYLTLMPNQMQGWGYRYMHPVLGNIVLFSVGILVAVGPEVRRRLSGQITFWLTVSAVVLVPWRSVQVEKRVAPMATASKALSEIEAEILVLDPHYFLFGADLVRNDPYLRNAPLMLLRWQQTDHLKVPAGNVTVIGYKELQSMSAPIWVIENATDP